MIYCVVTVLMACVGCGEVNVSKMLQKGPDGDIQSGSRRGNMPHTDRIILIDSFSCFSHLNCSRLVFLFFFF